MTFEQDAEFTEVLFRTDKSGEVTAVFPTIPASVSDHSVQCYAHVGQHGGCSVKWYYTTRRATPAEFADLKAELEGAPFGYRLKVCKNWTSRHRDIYDAAVAALRKGA